MTANILARLRPDLADFAGYSSAAKESDGAKPEIKLDANESPWPPFGPVATLCEPHRYVDAQSSPLRARLATLWGVKPSALLLTCGSDQGIDILLRAFCQAGVDSIMVCPPTFSMYEVYARLQGATTIRVPLREADGQLDFDAIEHALTPQTKLIFLPTPNAPMGHSMAKTDILALCKRTAGQCVIVADEAYVAFSDDPEGLAALTQSIDNLVVLRTLSKAYALAGERVGAVLASEQMIAALARMMPPYPLAQSALRAAMDSVSVGGLALSRTRWQTLRNERTRIAQALSACPAVTRVFPSQTNFLFLETTDAKALMERLRRDGIQARLMDTQKPNAVRISLGTPEQNDALLSVLGLRAPERQTTTRCASLQRQTKETKIDCVVNLDRAGDNAIATGLGFFDHMLDQIATHGGFSLTMKAKGDLTVDTHHTIEDCAIVLGQVLREALGDKKGINRFGFTAPLDEAMAQIVLDLSGRPFLSLTRDGGEGSCDGMGWDMVEHFLRSFTTTLGATLQVTLSGDNRHHMIESCFKALGRTLREAMAQTSQTLPSTKGVL